MYKPSPGGMSTPHFGQGSGGCVFFAIVLFPFGEGVEDFARLATPATTRMRVHHSIYNCIQPFAAFQEVVNVCSRLVGSSSIRNRRHPVRCAHGVAPCTIRYSHSPFAPALRRRRRRSMLAPVAEAGNTTRGDSSPLASICCHEPLADTRFYCLP